MFNSYFLGYLWARWIEAGVTPEAFKSSGLNELFVADPPPLLTTDDSEERKRFAFEFYQFLLRGLLRDSASLVEGYLKNVGLLPEGWSRWPPAVYYLRILRNGVTHNWKIGRVHRTVTWRGKTFHGNVGSEAPQGSRQGDPIEPYLESGAEMLQQLMHDVLSEIETIAGETAWGVEGT